MAQEQLLDSFSIDTVLRRLGANGTDAAVLEHLSSLLKSCSLWTVGALRRFGNLSELTAEMFDSTTSLGRLKAQGLLAAIHVSASGPCSNQSALMHPLLLSRDSHVAASLRMCSVSHKYP